MDDIDKLLYFLRELYNVKKLFVTKDYRYIVPLTDVQELIDAFNKCGFNSPALEA